MMEVDIDDVISKLWSLRSFSEELSRPLDHETALPDDPIPFFVERIEGAFSRYEAATIGEAAAVQEELAEWLARSYRFYLRRLAKFDRPWVFTFPKVDLVRLH